MNFDEVIERRNTHCMKWDMMESIYGISSETGIPMWVADMDFRPPEVARQAIEKMLKNGIFGYFGNDLAYRNAVVWWMENRHGWKIDADWIFTTHGLVNGTSLCVDSYTQPGDGVVLFTPVYHAFSRILIASNRQVVECPLSLIKNRYTFDFEHYDSLMSGKEKMAILCSPQNPGGRVWTRDELLGVYEFCERHDLILVSDEIHHDLVMPGQSHTVFPIAAPDSQNRSIVLSATTKTFNLAGAHIGNVIIADANLRKTFSKRMAALGISPNSFGMFLVESVYSSEGAKWVDALVQYINENRKLFDQEINKIQGLSSMPLEATYLAWVSFKNSRFSETEIQHRFEQVAQIATNQGPTFGTGGEGYHRFNLATPRSLITEAINRLKLAFEN